jgi:hypothetical protein
MAGFPGQRSRNRRALSRGTLGTPELGRTFAGGFVIVSLVFGFGLLALLSITDPDGKLLGVVLTVLAVWMVCEMIPIAQLHLQEKRLRLKKAAEDGA